MVLLQPFFFYVLKTFSYEANRLLDLSPQCMPITPFVKVPKDQADGIIHIPQTPHKIGKRIGKRGGGYTICDMNSSLMMSVCLTYLKF